MIAHTITMTSAQAWTAVLAFLALGMLAMAAVTRWAENRDPSADEQLVVDQDEALALAPAVAFARPCDCRPSDACVTCSVRRGEHADQDLDPFVAPYPQLQVTEHPFTEGEYPEHYADYCINAIPQPRVPGGDE